MTMTFSTEARILDNFLLQTSTRQKHDVPDSVVLQEGGPEKA